MRSAARFHTIRKSVDKAIYDTFWILSNDQIYMEFSDDFTVPLVSRQGSEEPFGWKNLLVGAGRGANCENTKGLLTNRDTGQGRNIVGPTCSQDSSDTNWLSWHAWT